MLIDSGPQNEKAIPEIQKFKSIFDKKINILLATHADADHIGTMKKISEKFQYQKFAYSGLSSDTKLFQDLMMSIPSDKDLTLTAGMSILLDSKNNIRFDVLFPDFDFQLGAYQQCQKVEREKANKKLSKISKSKAKVKFKNQTQPSRIKKDSCLKFLSTETNLNSVVGKLSYGSTSFLLTGDAPIEVEKFIIEKNNAIKSVLEKYISDKSIAEKTKTPAGDLSATVLKLGHHGSKTSTSAEFLEAVQPLYAIVSAGKDNRYGHPHKRVLDLISSYGPNSLLHASVGTHQSTMSTIQILRTDLDGTLSFYSDGKNVDPEK